MFLPRPAPPSVRLGAPPAIGVVVSKVSERIKVIQLSAMYGYY